MTESRASDLKRQRRRVHAGGSGKVDEYRVDDEPGGKELVARG